MSTGGSSLWKTLLLPPIFALLLYLLTSYVILPSYRRYRSRYPRTSYDFLAPITTFIRSHIPLPEVLNLRRRDSAGSGESLLGDEELEEEGFGGRERDCDGESRNGVSDGDRRLSLELERGFKDDSESDMSDDERRRTRL